jgi:hypothetical protein
MQEIAKFAELSTLQLKKLMLKRQQRANQARASPH